MRLFEVLYNNGEQYEDMYTRSLLFTDFNKAVEAYNSWPYDEARDYSFGKPFLTLLFFESDLAVQKKTVIVQRDYEEARERFVEEYTQEPTPVPAEVNPTNNTLGDIDALAALKAAMEK